METEKCQISHLLNKNGQTIDDFEPFGTSADGIVFMVCKDRIKQTHIDQLRRYLNNLESKLKFK